jgi:hypothetical protein
VSKSVLDSQVDQDILEDCPSLSADEAFELADKIEAAMDANPGRDWTPSELARKIPGYVETHKVQQVLNYLVRKSYIRTDERGAWSHYYR